jgi:SAM-dependent methyltransferase
MTTVRRLIRRLPPGAQRTLRRSWRVVAVPWRTLGNHVHAVVPRGALNAALREYPRFFVHRKRYRRLSGIKLSWSDQLPQLFDRTPTSPFDAHYTYQDAWAAHRIFAASPAHHVDVGSRISFVVGLTPFVSVTFVDIRPLPISIPGLTTLDGDILALPFEDQSVSSLSCLHVAEHIGLGRYGDRLDPDGTTKAARELERVLAPGGSLYFSVPVGNPRIAFNAHRIHDPTEIVELFNALALDEFAGVDDSGAFRSDVRPADLRDERYGCGFFHFVRP